MAAGPLKLMLFCGLSGPYAELRIFRARARQCGGDNTICCLYRHISLPLTNMYAVKAATYLLGNAIGRLASRCQSPVRIKPDRVQ